MVFRAYFEAGRPDSTTATYAVNDASMGTTIPAPGTYSVYVGDSITAAARANAGYELAYWTLATYHQGSVVSIDTFQADNPVYFGILPQGYADYGATITITAVFQVSTATQYTVTLLSADSTMGSVEPVGASAVNEGSTFTATAQPVAGYHFLRWEDGNGAVVSTDNPYTFTVTGDVSLVAVFEADPTERIDDAGGDEVNVYSTDGRIVVKGAGNMEVDVYDVFGRVVCTQTVASGTVEFAMNASGVYLVRVGNAPARRVVVVR